MFFKDMILVCSAMLLVAACNTETLPSHKQSINDEDAVELSEGIEIKDLTDYYDDHKKIEGLIASGDEQKLQSALQSIESELFSEMAKDPEVYSSKSYAGYLNLYVRAYVYWKAHPGNRAFSAEMRASLDKFKALFVDNCVDKVVSDCEMLKSSLRQESSTIAIINHFVEGEQDLNKRLNLAGFAFDMGSGGRQDRSGNRRRDKNLNRLYAETIIKISQSGSFDHVGANEMRRHAVNMVAIFQNINWADKSDETKGLFELVEPWKYDGSSPTTVALVREGLVEHIPQYAQLNSATYKGVKRAVKARLAELQKGSYDLSLYPAYDSVNLKSFETEDPLVVYLLLNIYYQNMDLKEGGAFLSRLQDPGSSAERLYHLSKTLIRWDVAQLSIRSTKSLATRFAEQEVKTKSFVQDTIDYGQELVPQWTEFHNVRLNGIKKFVSANSKYIEKTSDHEMREFYASINRNIMKTVVYPNMLGFIYHMAKTEWQAELRVFIWVISLDTTDVFDGMMSGRFYNPWFNFVNLTERSGTSTATRSSLFRTEILDSVYYFLSTRTAEEYEVNVDDFIKTAAETLMAKRLPYYDTVMLAQDQLYLSDDSVANQFVGWCRAIEKGEQPAEVISFYDLYRFLTPFTADLRRGQATAGVGLHAGDNYLLGMTSDAVFVPEVNDRLRLEFRPILHTILQMLDMAKRLAAKPVKLIGDLSESKEYYKYLSEFQKTYLGYQISIDEKLGDCMFTAGTEARKRAMKLAQYEHSYIKDVVHPLIKKAISGQISVDEANAILKDLHHNHPAFLDEIALLGKVASYKNTRLGFMFRMRQFLNEGLKVKHQLLQNKNLPPIAKNLEINLPPDILNDPNNFYFSTSGSLNPTRDIKYSATLSAEDFATSSVRLTMDRLSGRFWSIEKFTEWDQEGAAPYLDLGQRKIELAIQRLLHQGAEYLDVSRPECSKKDSEKDESCFKVNDFDLDDLGAEMAKNFAIIELTDEKVNYLKLIGYGSFINSYNMEIQVKMDTQAVYDIKTSSLPFSEAAGFFDMPMFLLDQDYLGYLYAREYTSFILASSQSGNGVSSCLLTRDGCNWSNEKVIAEEFFHAREKRHGLIFDFDQQILEDEYKFYKEGVLKKMQLKLELERRGPELLNKYRDGQLEYFFDLDKEPSQLKALSLDKSDKDVEYRKYMLEKTESFYLSEPDWDSYIDNE